jgi:tRNA/rRNA methyltransferase
MGNAVLENVSVLLVNPLQLGNVGSVARAMMNMGLSHLKLVGNMDLSALECRKMAMHATDILDQARIFDDFESAVAEEQILVGTTSVRGRKKRTPVQTVRSMAEIIREYAVSQRICLVFGPERKGLSEAQLACCQYLVTIPASPEFPTLNLAQSVMVLAYEIYTAEGQTSQVLTDLASQGEKDAMFRHIQDTLTEIGFLSQGTPEHIMRAIRRILGRSDLSSRDVQIVRGIMSQVNWYSRSGCSMDPEEVKKP